MHDMNMIDSSPLEPRFGRPGLPGPAGSRQAPEAPRNNLLRMVLRWWWITPCCVLAALAVAKYYIHKTPPIYESASRIYIQQSRPRILEDNPLAVQQSATYLTNESELIQSTPVLGLVVDQLPPAVRRMAQPVSYVKGGLSVGVSKTDDIMTVTFDSTNPVEAADIANAVVRGYVAYQANSMEKTVAETERVLETEKSHRDEEVRAKLDALSRYKRDNAGLAAESAQSAVISQALATISEKLSKAQLDLDEAEVNLDAARAVVGDPDRIQQFITGLRSSGDLPPNVELEDAQQSLRLLLQQKSANSGNYGPNSPYMKDLDAKIASIQLDKVEADSNLRTFKTYLASSAARVESKKLLVGRLKADYDQKQNASNQIASKLADYKRVEGDLEAEVARAERLDEKAEANVKELSIGKEIGGVKVEVLEPAKPSFDPVRPQKMTVLGIAVAMGMVLGFSGIVACDWMDTRLRSPEQVMSDLTVPVLGTVPHIHGGKNVALSGRQVMLDPMSEVAEAYRSIRTALYFGMQNDRARTILVTSPMPGEGKTTLASNLAISMAQAGRRTLILDADFRKPMQHVVFGFSGDLGLSSVLSGQASIGEAIHHTSIDRLDVLPCGPVPLNPSESLNSHGFQQLLDELSDEYDCVVLDSAPVVPVTDARILAAICDLTLLVLRAEQSTRKTSVLARNSLYSVGAEIAGIVLNDVSSWRGAGYSTYSYRSRRPQNGIMPELATDTREIVPSAEYHGNGNGNGIGAGNGNGNAPISLVTPAKTRVRRNKPQ
jgi:capsular exopolysaccharide synthesis family protein